MNSKISLTIAVLCLLAIVLAGYGRAQPAVAEVRSAEGQEVTAEQQAVAILDSSGLTGGLCVHTGCGSGRLTAELARDQRFLVQGLEAESELVRQARSFIQSKGLYGQVTVQQCDLGTLPYTDDLVNLVVISDVARYKIPFDEIMRVLCPGGVALIGQTRQETPQGQQLNAERLKQVLAGAGISDFEIIERAGIWARIEKPVPAGMDDWRHPRYDATGNAVSEDTVAGLPRRVRWVTGPLFGPNNMVTVGGRNFYGGVYARDSFNGVLLWRRDLRMGKPLPVVCDEQLFVVHKGKLLALDPATGKTIRLYKDAGNPAALRYAEGDGILVMLNYTSVRALDAKTGKRLWLKSASVPWCLTVADGGVFYVHGNPRRGERCSAIKLDLATGKLLWEQKTRSYRHEEGEHDWLRGVTTCSYHDGLLAFEVSTFTDFTEGSGIYVVSAEDGTFLWQRSYEPHGAHSRQARALFSNGLLWIVYNHKIEGLDPATGEVKRTLKGGYGHCYPPVATTRYLWSGEMSITDLTSGELDENRITKGSCSRTVGVIPANGLVNTFAKGCSCWPMLKGFAALAPARSRDQVAKQDRPEDFVLEHGPAAGSPAGLHAEPANEWGAYRHDAWRSGSTACVVPTELGEVWQRRIGERMDQQPKDWQDNPFVSGVITAPVVASNTAIVALPDRHQVVALDARTGRDKWKLTVDGRIDTPPTITGDLCLFGTRAGWLYALRIADGALAWRLRPAPCDEQIVAFGQLESPWPIAGSVLVIDDIAYVAAGRQYLADGGIRVLAIDVETGKVRWVSRINDLPDIHYYGAGALEFDNYDLMVREGAKVNMSRWQFDRFTGDLTVVRKSGFGYFATGQKGVMAPRGCWTYGPRQTKGGRERTIKRPLVVFRDNVLIGCTDDRRGLYRRDFSAEAVKQFDDEWYSARDRQAGRTSGGEYTRTERMVRGAKWVTSNVTEKPVSGMVLADDKCFVVDESGALQTFATADGKLLARHELAAPPIWDGLAAAYGQLYVATSDGNLVCLAKR